MEALGPLLRTSQGGRARQTAVLLLAVFGITMLSGGVLLIVYALTHVSLGSGVGILIGAASGGLGIALVYGAYQAHAGDDVIAALTTILVGVVVVFFAATALRYHWVAIPIAAAWIAALAALAVAARAR